MANNYTTPTMSQRPNMPNFTGGQGSGAVPPINTPFVPPVPQNPVFNPNQGFTIPTPPVRPFAENPDCTKILTNYNNTINSGNNGRAWTKDEVNTLNHITYNALKSKGCDTSGFGNVVSGNSNIKFTVKSFPSIQTENPACKAYSAALEKFNAGDFTDSTGNSIGKAAAQANVEYQGCRCMGNSHSDCGGASVGNFGGNKFTVNNPSGGTFQTQGTTAKCIQVPIGQDANGNTIYKNIPAGCTPTGTASGSSASWFAKQPTLVKGVVVVAGVGLAYWIIKKIIKAVQK